MAATCCVCRARTLECGTWSDRRTFGGNFIESISKTEMRGLTPHPCSYIICEARGSEIILLSIYLMIHQYVCFSYTSIERILIIWFILCWIKFQQSNSDCFEKSEKRSLLEHLMSSTQTVAFGFKMCNKVWGIFRPSICVEAKLNTSNLTLTPLCPTLTEHPAVCRLHSFLHGGREVQECKMFVDIRQDRAPLEIWVRAVVLVWKQRSTETVNSHWCNAK